MADSSKHEPRLNALPAVSAVLGRPRVAALAAAHGHAAVTGAVRAVLADARAAILTGGEGAVSDDDVAGRVARGQAGTLRPVLNATGVIVHTNLGRAPLAPQAIAAMAEVAAGYSTLEYDLEKGTRGERSVHATELLRELTGAEDALVVNNNAAAVMLVLAALAVGREVVVSRGELVEIGGGFRIPDVLRQSGARLVEVGTTNRTHPADYANAIGEDTALLMKVHRSNFSIVGFTREVALAELAAIGRARGVPVVYDAGSGAMLDIDAEEPSVRSFVAAGADVVTFSGDKLLGGPQAGVIVGTRALVERMRRHPLMRALRPDKTCLAALAATLRLWRDAPAEIPVVRMMHATVLGLEARAAALAAAVGARGIATDVVPSVSRVGGGAAPMRELASRAVRVRTADADALCAALRAGSPPVVARIDEGAVFLDLRTVGAEDDGRLAAALVAAWAASNNGR
jgi:L-seryl-tRNA(Ser) seleniumtransferase